MIDCACGEIHESNWNILVDIDEETGEEFWSPALCEKHARHEPCRRCLAKEAEKDGYNNYLEWLRER